MPSYMITGAAGGLGSAFIKVLAADPENTVIGLDLVSKVGQDRQETDKFSNVHFLQADITDTKSLNRAAAEATAILGNKGLDVLINNAAYINRANTLRSLAEDEDKLQSIVDEFRKSFDTNVIGTLNVVNIFLPLIKAGKEKKVVAISSGMSDLDFINELHLSDGAPYSVSKAALGILVAKLGAAYEDQGILFISLCPGLVDTAGPNYAPSADELARLQVMGAKLKGYAPNFKGPAPPEEAAESLLQAIRRSSLEGGSGGSFLSHNGTRKWL